MHKFVKRTRAALVACVVLSLSACGGGNSVVANDIAAPVGGAPAGEAATAGTPAAPGGPGPAPAAIMTLGDAIRAAEAAGQLPRLNRERTVAGPDADANGVRDDIDAYVAALPSPAEQRGALLQLSRALQVAMLADTGQQSGLIAATRGIAKAVACIHQVYPTGESSRSVRTVEKFTVNTRTRFDAYERFNVAISGTSTVYPRGDVCEN
ncbi:hypothetical protein GT347_04550 [Xylophilus rhododendri]|uniref:Lipoprotein n=1 Tax=Xylophilus rhododendri TaxID=2697032 RepID=A0A857J2M3_9BURK|nr:hypothetical protein [Xylophilus rhododendri]QHI97312.1 hypothetical protein GT347_04550 [Xylophilus rhododendri]